MKSLLHTGTAEVTGSAPWRVEGDRNALAGEGRGGGGGGGGGGGKEHIFETSLSAFPQAWYWRGFVVRTVAEVVGAHACLHAGEIRL